MSKKRRTKSQKIITKLKRELQTKEPEKQAVTDDSLSITYENDRRKTEKKEKINLYTFDPSLIKKDLVKISALAVFFLALIGFFYWFFELGGSGILTNI